MKIKVQVDHASFAAGIAKLDAERSAARGKIRTYHYRVLVSQGRRFSIEGRIEVRGATEREAAEEARVVAEAHVAFAMSKERAEFPRAWGSELHLREVVS